MSSTIQKISPSSVSQDSKKSFPDFKDLKREMIELPAPIFTLTPTPMGAAMAMSKKGIEILNVDGARKNIQAPNLSQLLYSNFKLYGVNATESSALSVFDCKTSTHTKISKGAAQEISAIAFVQGQDSLLAVGKKNVLETWDLTTNTCIDTFAAHSKDESITSITTITTQGSITFAFWSLDGCLEIWKNKKRSALYLADYREACLAFLGSSSLAVGSTGIFLINPTEAAHKEDMPTEACFEETFGKVTSLSTFGNWLAAAHEDNTFCIWDIPTKKMLMQLDDVSHGAIFEGGIITAKGRQATFSFFKSTEKDDTADDKLLATIQNLKLQTTFKVPGFVNCLADTKEYTAIGTMKGLYLWKESTPFATLEKKKWVTFLLPLTSQYFAAAYHREDPIYLWEVLPDNKYSCNQLDGHTDTVSTINSINAFQFASGDRKGNMIIWDILTRKALVKIETHRTALTSITATSTLLYAWNNLNQLSTWDISDIRNPKRLNNLSIGDWNPAFLGFLTPHQIVFAQNHIAIIDPSGKTQETPPYFSKSESYGTIISLAVWGKRFIASTHKKAFNDQRFCIWDIKDKNNPIKKIEGVNAAAVFPGGFSIGKDCEVEIWRPEVEDIKVKSKVSSPKKDTKDFEPKPSLPVSSVKPKVEDAKVDKEFPPYVTTLLERYKVNNIELKVLGVHFFAVATRDLLISVHSILDLEQDPTLLECCSDVTALCELNENQIFSGHKDGVIKLWNVKNQKCIQEMQFGNKPISQLSVAEGLLTVQGEEFEPKKLDIQKSFLKPVESNKKEGSSKAFKM